ncbi:uncharacterized protein LOC130997984 [Salvia miltiorrhiza]|uniref:uncharacterized protein LOC130997984 n=1 Tax=Salvia miltiorrhiza TaxID=226208 RepID=UPI0025AB74D9|nr:uncharacterized protein LOC130997984 [Salvia miltiorrhiza]
MGNSTSCFTAQSNTAKLIDLHRETVRVFGLPTTAAELMLEAPGRVVSPVSDLRRDRRFSAMKADEILAGGGVYILIPVSRVNGKVSESEMAALDSFCGDRRSKRRSSKVLPVVAEVSDDGCDNPARLLGEESDIGRQNHRVKQWKPALEPIYEGI